MYKFKTFSFFLFFLFSKLGFSLDDNKYEIDKIYNEKVFYNILSIDNNVYLSTNKGVYIIKYGRELVKHDLKIRGPVDKYFNSIKFDVRFIQSPIPIQLSYSKSVTDFLYFNDYLYIISKGHLLIYKSNYYSYKPYESVRSISKNFIGSYGGVFYKDKKIKSVTYVDGQIKEFDTIAFVCYGGLLYLKGDDEFHIYNNSNHLDLKLKIGNIRDIFYLNQNNYLVTSDKGIFKFNLLSKDFEPIYLKEKRIAPLRKNFRDGYEFEEEFLFADGFFLKSLNIDNYDTKVLYKFNDSVEDLVASGNLIYALTNNSTLIVFDYDAKQVREINKIELNLKYHTIEKLSNFLVLSGNNDLAIFDIKENNFYPNVIIDEFNKGAIYKNDKSISIGSIHGVYKFKNIEKFVGFLNYQNLKNTPNSLYFIYILILIIICVALVFIFKFRLNSKVVFTNEELVVDIKKYIDKNLNIVTVNSIQSVFNLEHAAIYHLSSSFKPGEYIKAQRERRAFNLISSKKSNDEIAKMTGYSLSYIKKNKSRLATSKWLYDIFSFLSNLLRYIILLVDKYTKQIDLTNNAKGIYFLEIETNDGVINKKLILQ